MTTQQNYAVLIPAREQAELVAVEPETGPLEPDEVAGRSVVTLISAGTELASAYLAEEYPKPRAPGYAAVFEVEEVGSEVTDLKAGDRVFSMGRHRLYQRSSRDTVLPLPEGLPPEAGVFARMMGVSMSTLTTTTARPPEKVLVMGQGVVGNLAAQIFARCGYEVMACEPDERRQEIARQAGIERVVSSVPLEDPEVAGQVGLAIDCSGHEQAVVDALQVVKKRGEVALIGAPWRRRSDLYAHEVLRTVFFKYLTLRSGWEWELALHPTDFRTNSIWGNLAAALRWLAEGKVCVDGLYTTASPKDAQQVYQDLLHNRCSKLTVEFDWKGIG